MSVTDVIAVILPILIFVALAVGMAWLSCCVTRFEYKIDERYIIIKSLYWGLLPIGYRVKLDSIIDMQLVDSNLSIFTFYKMLFKSKPWPVVWGKFPPKLFWKEFPSKLIFIKKRGILGTVVISPSNPTAFVEELKAKVTLPAVRK